MNVYVYLKLFKEMLLNEWFKNLIKSLRRYEMYNVLTVFLYTLKSFENISTVMKFVPI